MQVNQEPVNWAKETYLGKGSFVCADDRITGINVAGRLAGKQ